MEITLKSGKRPAKNKSIDRQLNKKADVAVEVANEDRIGTFM